MEIDRFVENCPGELVRIDEGDHAFIPAPLPPSWEFPSQLWPLLADAKQQVGLLEGLGRNLPNPTILLRPLEDREAIKSSQLEGTYATPKELLLFEMEPREPKSKKDKANDWREVHNYRRALHVGCNSSLPLSQMLLRDLHRTLMLGVRGKDRAPGEFRRVQVYLGYTKRFIPPPASQLMECLDAFEKYLHNTSGRYDPLVECFLVHYQFETIHPFVDGNGRVGRLLLAIMLQQLCGLTKPWLYLSAFFEKYRDEYIDRLFKVSAQGGWESWIEFCLEGTRTQATDTVQRCEKLLAVRADFAARVESVGGSVRLSQIIERVFYSPFVRVADLGRELGVTYPTAKSDVERLVAANVLRELENLTPKTYYAPEVFDVAYEDAEDESTS